MPECILNVASEEVADFIYQYTNDTYTDLYGTLQTNCIDIVNSDYVISYRPLQEVAPISLAKYGYSHIPKLYGLLDKTALTASGITPVFDNPNIDASGKGIIIGFIDTGINYQNSLFRKPDGSSRIIGIWDQTIQPPASEQDPFFLYGTVYDQPQINAALASAAPLSLVPTTDTDGHGTFMAGVAAGNLSEADNFMGAAPDAMIAVVKLKPAKQYLRDVFLIAEDVPAFQENDIMMGIRYLLQLSAIRRAPVVIYIGVGTNQGGHTGQSPLGLLIKSSTLSFNAIFLTGAGNETGLRHHFAASLPPNQAYEDVEIRVAEQDRGFSTELWSKAPELFTVGFVSPAGEVIEPLPNVADTETTLVFHLSNSKVTVMFMRSAIGSGNPMIHIRFEAPAPGIWHIRVYPTVYFTGNFHMWLPMDRFISPETFFLNPNPDTNITELGNSSFILTIAAYDHLKGQIYIHSSRGWSLDQSIVPVIAAPGVKVYGPGLENGTFTRRTGTSVAAALAAGGVADILSHYQSGDHPVQISNASILAYLIRGADNNPALIYPSREWGYGTLNVFNSIVKG